MRIALEVKNKFDFVDGIVLCPEVGDPKLTSWKRCNQIVCSWMLKSINPNIAESVMYLDNASHIWSVQQKRCLCTLMSRMQKQREEDYIIRFLEGLNEDYETIKSGILDMDPIPDMEKNQAESEESVVEVIESNNRRKFTNNGGKNVPKCTFCGMLGHTIEKFYKKH
ncbi:PREDICTED: uncharacterized protein LOC109184330 [Ipomoea nil]|uniref:uncharacterized protein LOC109184330 n=1 Tax=Ipomoea nil TaxID=35883 RepID=UPI0009016C0E|nr:PREDICTED: uncharacterized protein LOC109184330 [Ipomoea nil]